MTWSFIAVKKPSVSANKSAFVSHLFIIIIIITVIIFFKKNLILNTFCIQINPRIAHCFCVCYSSPKDSILYVTCKCIRSKFHVLIRLGALGIAMTPKFRIFLKTWHLASFQGPKLCDLVTPQLHKFTRSR